MARRIVLVCISVVLLMLYSYMTGQTIAREAYPFEALFRRDLLEIANSVSQIETIYIKGYLDLRPSGHLWAFIRINYTTGLSDLEKMTYNTTCNMN